MSARARWRSAGSSTAAMDEPPARRARPAALRLRVAGRSVRRRRQPARASRADSARSGAVPPDQLAQGGGPAEVDVGVVLPGEAHPAEDLDGALGRLDVAVEGQGRGELDGEAPLVGLLTCGRAALGLEDRGGVPGGGHTLLDGDQHVGQPVLDPLELADRPAELLAGPGVFGGRVEAPAGAARRPRPTARPGRGPERRRSCTSSTRSPATAAAVDRPRRRRGG